MKMDRNAIDILKERGFIYQSTDLGEIQSMLEKPTTFYVGFDPTADSLHVGHLLPLMGMKWLQQCGHHPIALIGGGTALVGDPSGRTDSRPMLTPSDVAKNSDAIREQLRRIACDSHVEILDNERWLGQMNLLDFARIVGSLVSVPHLLQQESMKLRMENGMTFLEFIYPLLQAYDFQHLNEEFGCSLQLGGQDQWGNMTAGTELIRKISGNKAHALTFPLLLKSDGTKFGKSVGGAVWLDPKKTSPFDYYQFWRNTDDKDVKKLLALFTMLPMDEVNRLGSLEPPKLNRAKEILAFEATAIVHGLDEAESCYWTAGKQFGFSGFDDIETSSKIGHVNDKMPVYEVKIPTYHVESVGMDGLPLFKLLVSTGLCKTSSEARRLVRGGGCYVDGKKADASDETVDMSLWKIGSTDCILGAGKKKLVRVIFDWRLKDGEI